MQVWGWFGGGFGWFWDGSGVVLGSCSRVSVLLPGVLLPFSIQRRRNLTSSIRSFAKAFDKVDREGMMIALERMGIPDKLVALVRQLYKKQNSR